MFLITCPFCGPREESEFAYGGEAGIARPNAPDSMSDEDWAGYLFMRRNPRGVLDEMWCHSAGCRKWFTIRRDTVSNRIEIPK
jgi:sarcosine oxidase, subunit delta